MCVCVCVCVPWPEVLEKSNKYLIPNLPAFVLLSYNKTLRKKFVWEESRGDLCQVSSSFLGK